MKKVFFCVSLVLSGLMTSCVEKHELVDEDSMPSWLGGSIYSELRNPSSGQLKGTFSTYLQLINDLGYTEELNRTGSVTVFPANDDAFTRFFQTQTDWKKGDGSYVRSYSDLSEAQKKQLLLSSMLGNALLTNMLSNIQSGNTTEPGRVMKHETRMGLVDSVTTYPLNTAASVYPNNPFWTGFTKGVSVVADGTTPMMIHFTPEFMTNNTITTDGSNSDFAILMRLAASNILPSLTPQKIIKQVQRVLSKYGDEDECSAICVRPNAAYPECVWSDGRDETYTMP